jgi:hypothetical protein
MFTRLKIWENFLVKILPTGILHRIIIIVKDVMITDSSLETEKFCERIRNNERAISLNNRNVRKFRIRFTKTSFLIKPSLFSIYK